MRNVELLARKDLSRSRLFPLWFAKEWIFFSLKKKNAVSSGCYRICIASCRFVCLFVRLLMFARLFLSFIKPVSPLVKESLHSLYRTDVLYIFLSSLSLPPPSISVLYYLSLSFSKRRNALFFFNKKSFSPLFT